MEIKTLTAIFNALMCLSCGMSITAGTVCATNGMPDMGLMAFSAMFIIVAYVIVIGDYKYAP